MGNSISSNPNIKQKVVLKGYPNILEVDLREGGFHGVSESVLLSKNNFFEEKDNINRRKLAKDREEKIRDAIDKGERIEPKSVTRVIDPKQPK